MDLSFISNILLVNVEDLALAGLDSITFLTGSLLMHYFQNLSGLLPVNFEILFRKYPIRYIYIPQNFVSDTIFQKVSDMIQIQYQYFLASTYCVKKLDPSSVYKKDFRPVSLIYESKIGRKIMKQKSS